MQSSVKTCLLTLGLAAGLTAQEIKLNLPAAGTPAPAAAPAAAPATTPAPAAEAPAVKFTDEQLAETWGWIMGRRIGVSELDFSKEQIAAIAKGFVEASSGQDLPFDINKAGPQMDEFMRRKQVAYMEKLKQHGMKETMAFMAEIKKKPGVQTTGSGLAYEIVAQGEGASPKPTDIVKVNYTGALVSGEVFDSSSRAGQPIEIGLDQVISGWTEGLQKIGKGGKMKLYVPPHLAYGDDGKGAIPPAATLIFEIELVDFKPAPAAPAAPATPAPAGK